MRRMVALVLLSVILLSLAACGVEEVSAPVEPQIARMRSICELATMDCYYHNVAKFFEEGNNWFSKDKHFWVEYSGVVTLGVDASLITLQITGNEVLITIPPATVKGVKVDSTSLTEDSFIVDKDSGKISAEDQTKAFEGAQAEMERNAAADTTLLANAQQRAQNLLEDYVTNVGNAIGMNYYITWVYVDENGNPLSSISTTQPSESIGE